MNGLLFDLEDHVVGADKSLPKVLRFTVLGRGQQRGSKLSHVLYGRDGKPVLKNGRPFVVTRDDNDHKSLTYMQEVRTAAMVAMLQQSVKMITGPIELSCVFYFNRPKAHFRSGKLSYQLRESAPKHHAQSPDLAKLVRCLEDALKGVAWLDDKLVFRYRLIERRWTDEAERVEVEIKEID
jgi:Holliday junction resolvase RusA-like endonuclease